MVYLDDILVFSTSREEYIVHLRKVLTRLRRFALYANRKKCDFFLTEIKFLGYVVSTVGVTIDPRRVASIVE